MAESPLYDLLHAYALGCLEKEDIKKIKSYFRSGKEFEWSELGEYQNLGAMLPAILNIETPPAQLKDKVARKLYRMRDEKRKALIDLSKITQVTAKQEPAKEQDGLIPENPVPEFSDLKGPLADIPAEDLERMLKQNEADSPQNNSYQTKFEIDPSAIDNWKEPEESTPEPIGFNVSNIEPEPDRLNKKEPEENSASFQASVEQAPIHENIQSGKEIPVAQPSEQPAEPPVYQNPILERLSGGTVTPETGLPELETKQEGKSRKGIWAAVIILFVLFLALAGGIYYIFMLNMKNTKEIEKLRQQAGSQTLKADVNNDIIAILSSRDFKVADLKPQKESAQGYGKVIMSFDMKIAYFQYAQLPELGPGKVYQLWANISGNTMSLGQFIPKAAMNYQPLPKLPVIDKDISVSFLLTEEKTEGAEAPSNNVFLTGKI